MSNLWSVNELKEYFPYDTDEEITKKHKFLVEYAKSHRGCEKSVIKYRDISLKVGHTCPETGEKIYILTKEGEELRNLINH